MAHRFNRLLISAVVLSGGVVLPAVALAQAQKDPQTTTAPKSATKAVTKPGAKPVTKTDPAGKPAAEATPAKPKQRKLTVPLAPTQDELQRQRAASQRNADDKKDEARASRGRYPTQLGNTSGPNAPQGAGTVQDRKAATIDASGPSDSFRR